MHPVLLNLGPITLFTYGFMVALGFICGILVALYYAKQEGISKDTVFDLAIYVIIFALIGARLFYVIGQWGYYKNNLFEIFMLQRGGLVILGGILFAIATLAICSRIKHLPLLKLLDIATPTTAIGIAIGRIGCFMNGCCFGLPTKMPWGVVFPAGSLAYSYFPNQHIHPTQLYSSFSVLLIFFILVLLYKHKKFDGFVFLWGVILYSLYRFIVEFFRFSPMHWWGLTPSQWIVLVLVVVAVAMLVRLGLRIRIKEKD